MIHGLGLHGLLCTIRLFITAQQTTTMIAVISILLCCCCCWCDIALALQSKLRLKREIFTRLFVESVDSKTVVDESSLLSSNNINININNNIINNNIIIDNSDNVNNENKSTMPPRVYRSKSQLQSPSSSFGGGGEPIRPIGSNSALLLVNPHFLIRYRTPKLKSSLKTQLEELQVSYYSMIL